MDLLAIGSGVLAALCGGGIAALVRQSGRVSVLEARVAALEAERRDYALEPVVTVRLVEHERRLGRLEDGR